ncbi:MAG TPA: diaminopimelate decarboxylase, partial [Acidimicrobiales bacterium]|nr:diaminopimelate decarboxylase [Acidimicrobiales bacterium]
VRNTPGLDLVGIHAHIGSQVFAAESFAKAVEVLAGFFVGLDLEELCIGGGLGVGYVEGETAPTISQWASVVKKAAKAAGIPSQVRITAEPGRSIVAQAAITIYRAGTIKQIAGLKTFIAVDGGMSDNPRPVLYGSGYEIFSPSDVLAERSLIADVVGKHCESGDFIVKAARVPASVAVGTYLATPVSGAYGYSMASNYNRVPRPAVLFVKDGQSRVVVRRETFEDLVALDV